MSKLLSKLTSSKKSKSRLDSKLTKLTNSSESSSPSLHDLHEIAIFSFSDDKLDVINEHLTRSFEIIKASSSKALYKNLIKISKALVVFQYLIQVGSERFLGDWKASGRNNHYEVLKNLSDNLTSIENSNLCQETGFNANSSSAKVRNYLSSTINKLAKSINYLSDDQDLREFRDSFQKLRSDMSKPTLRKSVDTAVRGGITTPNLIDLDTPMTNNPFKSKSLDIYRNSLAYNNHDLQDFTLVQRSMAMSRSSTSGSHHSPFVLSPLIEVQEPVQL